MANRAVASQAAQQLVAAALVAADLETSTPHERMAMLVEIAMSLQHRSQDAEQLCGAVALYVRAIALCAPDDELIIAQIRARMRTARTAAILAG